MDEMIVEVTLKVELKKSWGFVLQKQILSCDADCGIGCQSGKYGTFQVPKWLRSLEGDSLISKGLCKVSLIELDIWIILSIKSMNDDCLSNFNNNQSELISFYD